VVGRVFARIIKGRIKKKNVRYKVEKHKIVLLKGGDVSMVRLH
jgi:hypothetical protein